jgi:hypothetical protein
MQAESQVSQVPGQLNSQVWQFVLVGPPPSTRIKRRESRLLRVSRDRASFRSFLVMSSPSGVGNGAPSIGTPENPR